MVILNSEAFIDFETKASFNFAFCVGYFAEHFMGTVTWKKLGESSKEFNYQTWKTSLNDGLGEKFTKPLKFICERVGC